MYLYRFNEISHTKVDLTNDKGLNLSDVQCVAAQLNKEFPVND